MSLQQRFRSKVSFPAGGRGCWLWTASRDACGYGLFKVSDGWVRRAHLVSFSMYKGEVPAGLQLDHLCRNRACINPSHLEPVTLAENVRRGLSGTFNKRKTHCPNGHEYSGPNLSIRKLGKYSTRACKICMRDATRRYRERISKETA